MKQYQHLVQLHPTHEGQKVMAACFHPLVSTARDNCDRAMTGISSSLANALRFREIIDISCSRFPDLFDGLLTSTVSNQQRLV